ncbi:MAG: PaaI family thioesterase [Anaerolineaceae bacterium]|nr:MAG: PaaI family thioesterase [Anaerolineaceae bacterium]
MSQNIPQTHEGHNPFGELLGLNFTSLEAGRSRCSLEIREDLYNPYGVVHGGVIYSLADTGMGGAVYSRLKGDELCSTVEIKIVYFRPVVSGTLTCDSEVIRRGRRLAFIESEIRRGDRLIAKATGTFSIFKAEGGLG